MKFFLPIAALLAGSVSAQDPDCEADYIVATCLGTETAKIAACATADLDCQCAAYQAVATCYNNCPKDPRFPAAQNQVTIYCQNASLHGSKATAIPVPTSSIPISVGTISATVTKEQAPTNTAARTSASSTPNVGAAELAFNTGGVLLAVAGVVAAIL